MLIKICNINYQGKVEKYIIKTLIFAIETFIKLFFKHSVLGGGADLVKTENACFCLFFKHFHRDFLVCDLQEGA